MQVRIDKHETSKQNPWKQRCLTDKQDEISMQQVEAERNGRKSIWDGQVPWSREITETDG